MSSNRAGELRQFLARADAMRAQIHAFTQGAPSVTGSELQVAIEELRAQTDVLGEACERLECEAAKYRHLYDGAPDALVMTDARGVIQDANRPTATLLGFPHEALPGKLLIAFIARGDTVLFRDQLRAIATGRGQGSFAARFRPRGGSPRLGLFAARAVRPTLRTLRSEREVPVALHWTIRPDTRSLLEQKSVHDLFEAFADELRAAITTERAQAMREMLDQSVALAKENEPPQAVSVAAIAALVVDRARPAARARNVILHVEGADGVGARTLARADHLVWALDRLLAQAIEAATSPGAVRVHLGAHQGHATLRVCAPGAQAPRGSRLAMAVASAAVERYGGVLNVPEIVEDGLVCEVRLPLTPEDLAMQGPTR